MVVSASAARGAKVACIVKAAAAVRAPRRCHVVGSASALPNFEYAATFWGLRCVDVGK